MDYKMEITNMLLGIENEKFLEFVYRFIKRLKENWGL
jgi:hypothetical protein